MHVLLILAFFLCTPFLVWCCLTGTAAIVASTIFVFIIVILILAMFASVLYAGLGRNRSVLSVCSIAASGIFAVIAHFSILYRWIGFQTSLGEPSCSYLEALYFSVVTWTTLGFGDFVPQESSRHIVMVEAMLGYIMMALLIAVFISIIQRHR